MSSLSLDDLMLAANRAHAEERFSDCDRLCRALLEKVPGSVPVLVLAGVANLKNLQAAESENFLKQAVLHDPRCAPAFLWLSMSQRKLGKSSEALKNVEFAVRLQPNDPIALHHLGLCQFDMQDFRNAEVSLQKAAALSPSVSIIQHSLGLLLQAIGRPTEATSAFRRALRLDPNAIDSALALRHRLLEDGDSTAAVEVSQTVLRLQPNSAEAHIWLARALLEAQRASEAGDYIKRAQELEPSSASAFALLGSIYQVNGQLDLAEAEFQKSLTLEPNQPGTALAFVNNRKMTEADRPFLEELDQLLSMHQGDFTGQSQIHYALGKAHEDLKEFHLAMEHWDKANVLAYRQKFGDHRYDIRSLELDLALIRKFTAEFLSQHSVNGSSSEMPIFVVGMIRSGTTLVEQILSSHSQVGAAGEQRFWLENSKAVWSGAGTRLEPSILTRLTERYQKILSEISNGKARVVDKMPMNYQVLGLIHLAFPKAKIIHIQRHPVDTCLSIYATPNRNRIPWAHNKANIVSAYRSYVKQMDHWQKVIPDKALLHVSYERLVAEQEEVTREIVQFCGLDWEDVCLAPERNQRSVVTPSVWQVRQPIYKTSVARWKKFEPWLGPFQGLLTL